MVEFTGGGFNKSTAIVDVREATKTELDDVINKSKSLGIGCVYIEGNFTSSLSYAKDLEGKSFKGIRCCFCWGGGCDYCLISNNCLHFVKKALSKGTTHNLFVDLYFKLAPNICPMTFARDLQFVVSTNYIPNWDPPNRSSLGSGRGTKPYGNTIMYYLR